MDSGRGSHTAENVASWRWGGGQSSPALTTLGVENKEKKSSSLGAVNWGPRQTCSVTEERRGGRESHTGNPHEQPEQRRKLGVVWGTGVQRSSESEKAQLQQDDSDWCDSVNINSLVSSLILTTTLEAGVAIPIFQVRKLRNQTACSRSCTL